MELPADASNPMTLEPVVSRLEKFILYETHSYFYIVGSDKRQREYRVIKLDRKVIQILRSTPRSHFNFEALCFPF
jgi:predicted RNase H-related nuclease YkuK (DUF458 family)